MTDKKCPFAILSRGHLRIEESLCLEDACAIWTGDKCALLSIANSKLRLRRFAVSEHDIPGCQSRQKV